MNFLKKLKFKYYKKNNIINLIQIVDLIILLILIKYSFKNRLILTITNNKIENKKFDLFTYFKDNQINFKYIKINNIIFYSSFKYKIVKIEYNITFYDGNNKILRPSEILLYNFSIICNIEGNDFNLNINSFAYIYENKFFKCIEFININEKIKLGIIIYQNYDYLKSIKIFFFNEKIINYNNISYAKNKIFFPLFYNHNYLSLIKKKNNKNINESLKLKYSFSKHPYFSLKRNIHIIENVWRFENIYNYYFCFCKGKFCLKNKINQNCKFYFYSYLIDNNRNLYKKTDYLFIDFIFNELPSDDVYPVFEEMKKQNLPAHYLTEKNDIYQKYCKKENNCKTIIRINKNNYYNNGDFLEKYFDLILKLKSVISAKLFPNFSISNLFYDIEFLTYIAVGHGVCYFKDYLYKENEIYGNKKNNKLLIPPSNKIISLAKKYGWKDEDIIKINLPRWDKYNILLNNNKNNEGIIFMMFTWRYMKKYKKISPHYINNISKLLTNKELYKFLKHNKIILYFSIHRNILNILNKEFKTLLMKNNVIKYIEQNDISNCLFKSKLVVTDFSSIIFDLIYQKKPYILYIPDANISNIETIYVKDYSDLILSMKNGTIPFENKYFSIQDTINKIIYYINNNFKLESKMKEFYDSFKFTQGYSINKFINYLNNLK